MQVKCNIITPAISSLAKEIGKSDAYTCNLVSAWQTEMYRGNIIPTKYQLDKYIKANQAKVEELKLAIPCYNYEQENGQSKWIQRLPDHHRKHHGTLPGSIRGLRGFCPLEN